MDDTDSDSDADGEMEQPKERNGTFRENVEAQRKQRTRDSPIFSDRCGALARPSSPPPPSCSWTP